MSIKERMKALFTLLSVILLLAVVVVVVGTTTTTTVYAQQQQQTPNTTAAQQIIDTAKAECASQINLGQDAPAEVQTVFAESCISLLHESPTMIVLNGDLLISTSPGLYSENTSLWKALNDFKNSGYSITSMELAGQGNQGNPHKLYVVMSK